MAWWNSPEYSDLAKFRHASVTTHSVSVVAALTPSGHYGLDS